MSGNNEKMNIAAKSKKKNDKKNNRAKAEAKKELYKKKADTEKAAAAAKEIMDANYPQATVPPKILELAALPVVKWFRLKGRLSADLFNRFLVILHKEQEALALKQLSKEKEENLRTDTEMGISKYCRRANAAVHPDKHGDKYVEEYQKLQLGREVMQNEKFRRNYISCMVSVLRSWDEMNSRNMNGSFKGWMSKEETVQHSHDSWWQNFQKHGDEPEDPTRQRAKLEATMQAAKEKSNKKSDNNKENANAARDQAVAAMAEQVLQIEAQQWQKSPGALSIYGVNYKELRVALAFQVQILEFENFVAACKAIVLKVYQDNDVEGTTEERRIEGTQLARMLKKSREEGDNDILDEDDRNYVVVGRYMRSTKEEVVLKLDQRLPFEGVWSFQWYALLQNDHSGRLVRTSYTRRVQRDLTNPAVVRSRRELPRLRQLAKQARAGLLRVLQSTASRRGHQKTKSYQESLERELWELHRAIGLGQLSINRLNAAMGFLDLNDDDVPEHLELRLVLNDAANQHSEIDALMEVGRKRDTLRLFKKSVAAEIERGTLASWIESVQKSDLVNHGGEVNRLYQLLVEDKKAQSNALYLDATALANAAERKDLFSPKQCQVLEQRASQVAAEHEQEMERLLQEEEAKKAEEENRRLLEERLKNMPCCRGACVQIFGLQQRPELNDKMGLFLGPYMPARMSSPMATERWLIQVNGQEVALKRENFKSLDYGYETTREPAKEKAQMATTKGSDELPQDGKQPAVEMIRLLTHGAVQTMIKPITVGRHQQPVTLQVLQINHVKRSNEDRIRLVLSDGRHSCEGMLSTKLNYLVSDETMQVNHLIKVKEYFPSTIQGRMTIVLVKAELLRNVPSPEGPIGNPTQVVEEEGSDNTVEANAKLNPASAATTQSSSKAAAKPSKSSVSQPQKKPAPAVKEASAPYSKPGSGTFKYPTRPRRESNCTWIHNSLAPEFIGPKGRHVQALQAETKTTMRVENGPSSLRDGIWACVRVYSGRGQGSVAKAMDLIEERYAYPMPISARQGAAYHSQISSSSSVTLKDFVARSQTSSKAAVKNRTADSNIAKKVVAPPASVAATASSGAADEKSMSASPPKKKPVTKPTTISEDKQRQAHPAAAATPPAKAQTAEPTSETRTESSSPPGFSSLPQQTAQTSSAVGGPLMSTLPVQQQSGALPLRAQEEGAQSHTEGQSVERSSPSGVVSYLDQADDWSKWDPTPADNSLGSKVAESVATSSNTSNNDMVPPNIQDLLSQNLLQDILAPVPVDVATGTENQEQVSLEIFLEKHKACLKVSPSKFAEWLKSLDVMNLEDLEDAVNDESFLEEMQENGLKGFKKGTFTKAVVEAAADNVVKSVPLHDSSKQVENFIQQSHQSPSTPTQSTLTVAGLDATDLGPPDLYCPISHELMVNDPVLASDGFTYERTSITAWMAKKSGELDIGLGSSILSPITNQPLPTLELRENTTIRSMARDYYLQSARKKGNN